MLISLVLMMSRTQPRNLLYKKVYAAPHLFIQGGDNVYFFNINLPVFFILISLFTISLFIIDKIIYSCCRFYHYPSHLCLSRHALYMFILLYDGHNTKAFNINIIIFAFLLPILSVIP